MFEDYDVFYEPTEAELIMQEALSNITSLFTDGVKRTIDEASKAKDRLDEINLNIMRAERRFAEASARFEQMQKRVDSAELYDVPRKYISKFVQHATGGYAPGDVVYVIQEKGQYKNCKTCNGTKKVTAMVCGNETKVVCPACEGRGMIFESRKDVVKEKVSSVYLKLCFDENRVCFWNTENVYIGSRDFHTNPKDIYRTEEDAVAALVQERKDNERKAD